MAIKKKTYINKIQSISDCPYSVSTSCTDDPVIHNLKYRASSSFSGMTLQVLSLNQVFHRHCLRSLFGIPYLLVRIVFGVSMSDILCLLAAAGSNFDLMSACRNARKCRGYPNGIPRSIPRGIRRSIPGVSHRCHQCNEVRVGSRSNTRKVMEITLLVIQCSSSQ